MRTGPESGRPRLAVVVINWNGKDVLPPMLESVRKDLLDSGERLILFDNGSSDDSAAEAARSYAGEGWLELISHPENVGFSAGANRALAGVDEELAVLANNDTVFMPGALEGIRQALIRRPEAGAVGPRLLWPDGSLQDSMRDFPFPGRLMREHLPLLRRGSARYSGHDLERTVDWFVGAVIGLRMEAFRQIGGFDEGFFFYHEETDLHYRMWREGWEVWFAPDARVVHHEGATAARVYGRERYYLRYIPAKMLFLRKYRGPGTILGFRAYMTVLQLWRLIVGLLIPGRRARDYRFKRGYCTEALSLIWSRGSTWR